jgi:hypothetical protein
MSLAMFFYLTVALVFALALACTGMPRRAAKTTVVLWLLLLAVLGLIG